MEATCSSEAPVVFQSNTSRYITVHRALQRNCCSAAFISWLLFEVIVSFDNIKKAYLWENSLPAFFEVKRGTEWKLMQVFLIEIQQNFVGEFVEYKFTSVHRLDILMRLYDWLHRLCKQIITAREIYLRLGLDVSIPFPADSGSGTLYYSASEGPEGKRAFLLLV